MQLAKLAYNQLVTVDVIETLAGKLVQKLPKKTLQKL